jgi:thiosulfate/3-mercaptopyruvate sulfurtransferase
MSPRTPFRRIDVDEGAAVIRRGDALILDVRDAGSFQKAHVDGAQHASSANLSAIISGTRKDRPVLIYCYHGNASREFAKIFSDFGFTEVYSLDGGYEVWRTAPRAAAVTKLDAALQPWLAEHGFPDIDAIIANATTPLMKASHRGEIAIVRVLIAAGSPLDARNADGNNALWLACVGGHLDVIDILVEAEIDLNNRNDNGATALMYGASSGKADVVARLLAKGADHSPETLDGFTALDLASTVECLALLRLVRPGGKAGAGTTASPTTTSPP